MLFAIRSPKSAVCLSVLSKSNFGMILMKSSHITWKRSVSSQALNHINTPRIPWRIRRTHLTIRSAPTFWCRLSSVSISSLKRIYWYLLCFSKFWECTFFLQSSVLSCFANIFAWTMAKITRILWWAYASQVHFGWVSFLFLFTLLSSGRS